MKFATYPRNSFREYSDIQSIFAYADPRLVEDKYLGWLLFTCDATCSYIRPSLPGGIRWYGWVAIWGCSYPDIRVRIPNLYRRRSERFYSKWVTNNRYMADLAGASVERLFVNILLTAWSCRYISEIAFVCISDNIVRLPIRHYCYQYVNTLRRFLVYS
jgi:hypothetical protein